MNRSREITIEDSDLRELLGLLLCVLIEQEMSGKKLVCDDEPLDAFLHGAETNGPTVANLFLMPAAYVDNIQKLNAEGHTHKVIAMAAELTGKDYPLSLKICYDLVRILAPLIPQYPKPILLHDITPLGPLFEKIWSVAKETKDLVLQEGSGQVLYRWYEHHQSFKEARRILTALMDVLQHKGDSISIAFLTNNYGFEYALEDRWQEAMPFFQQAAELFGRNNDEMNHANARANFFMSKIECGDFTFVEQHTEELENLNKKLENAGPWQKRKPWILLAKIEEHRGNIKEAIRLAESAIETVSNSATKYPELDGEYLASLIEKAQGSLF